jgi:hypothetical protein
MSKNELRVIARIVLIGVGLYVLLQTLLTILTSIASLSLIASSVDVKATTIIVAMIIYAVMTMAAVYFLVRCANRISAKIVGPDPAEDSQVSWLAVAFRLICVTAGVLFLYWSLPYLIVTLSMYMQAKPDQQHIYISSNRDNVIKYVVLLSLSIYLAYGAPGFVRWQVKRTLKQCNKIEEQHPTWS